MSQKTNPKITFDHTKETDLMGNWFEQDKEYKQSRQENYQHYLQLFQAKFIQNPTNQMFMTYINIVNFITKNAVIATIIMILALSTLSVAATELLAPREYKPSTLLGLNKIVSFEECQKAGGKITEDESASSCEINGQTFVKINQACLDENCETTLALKHCSFDNGDGRNFMLIVPDSFKCEATTFEYEKMDLARLQVSNGKIRVWLDYLSRPGCVNQANEQIETKCGDSVFYENANYTVFTNEYGGYSTIGGRNQDNSYPAIVISLLDNKGQEITGENLLQNLTTDEQEYIRTIVGSIQPQEQGQIIDKPQENVEQPIVENSNLMTFNKSNFSFQYTNSYNVNDRDDSNAPEGYDNIILENSQDKEKIITVSISPEDPLEFMNRMIVNGTDPKISLDTHITNKYGITARKLTHQFNYADAGWIPEFTTTEIVFQKDDLYYSISTKVGKLCQSPDNYCEYSKSDEEQLDTIFNTFKFSNNNSTQLSYDNPFYPDLVINYDFSWKFSTTTTQTQTPQVLARNITLEKNGVKLTFDLNPVEKVHNSCVIQLNYSEQIKLRENGNDNLFRYKISEENRYFYTFYKSEDKPMGCFSYLLQMANMERYQTNPNAQFEGELSINLTPQNANQQTLKEADKIVLNSKF